MPVENSAGSHISRRRRTRLRHAGSLLLVHLLAFPLVGASIQGSVIDAVSGAPVPRAHVTLLGEVNGRPVRYGATSGADGGFSFAGIAAGVYEGLAERPG